MLDRAAEKELEVQGFCVGPLRYTAQYRVGAVTRRPSGNSQAADSKALYSDESRAKTGSGSSGEGQIRFSTHSACSVPPSEGAARRGCGGRLPRKSQAVSSRWSDLKIRHISQYENTHSSKSTESKSLRERVIARLYLAPRPYSTTLVVSNRIAMSSVIDRCLM